MASDTYSDGEGEFDGDDINEKSSLSLSQEMGNPNKRKFKSEFPPSPEISSSSLTKIHEPELSIEKCSEMIKLDSIKAKFTQPKEDGGGWDDPKTLQLETLLSKSLRENLDSAIVKITEFGYAKEVAESVVLRCGPFSGTHDMVSNIVDCALACLSNEYKEDDTSKFYIFQDLQELVNYMMVEMVAIIREIKPYLSVAEAMWTLLIHDLNIFHACDAETHRAAAVQGEGSSTKTSSQSESKNQETVAPNANKPDSSKPSNYNPQISKSEEKSSDLRHKSFHIDKTYKGRISKGASKAKISARGGVVFDKRQKPPFDFSSGKKKNQTLPSKDTHPAPVPAPVPVSGSSSSAPKIMPTEKAKNAEKHAKSVDSCLATIPYDEVQGKYMPRDKQDKTILVAAARIECLKDELKHWDDWANRKVMQATKRLGCEQAELKMLRSQKAETEKMKKDKQILEESTMKRLSEMTCALNSANCQIEVASSAIGRLQYENSLAKIQMEAAQSQSSLEARKLDQAMVNEQEALKKSQSFGPQKELLQEELKALKLQAATKQQEVDKGKSVLAQTMAKGASVESETAKLVKQAESIRKERERLEALGKEEEKRTAEKAEKELKKYEDKIKQIEYEISALKLETETKKIAAMRKGMNPKGTKVIRNNESMKQKRDRECVMCLTEEKTVIFLPCAHQVLCANCNEIHEKKGMNECPSCRTPIEERFHARFAKS